MVVAELVVVEVGELLLAEPLDRLVEAEQRRRHPREGGRLALLPKHAGAPFEPVVVAVRARLDLRKVLRGRLALRGVVALPLEARRRVGMTEPPRLHIPHLAEEVRRVADHRVALGDVELAAQVVRRRARRRRRRRQRHDEADVAAAVEGDRVRADRLRQRHAAEVEEGRVVERPVVADVDAEDAPLGARRVEADALGRRPHGRDRVVHDGRLEDDRAALHLVDPQPRVGGAVVALVLLVHPSRGELLQAELAVGGRRARDRRRRLQRGRGRRVRLHLHERRRRRRRQRRQRWRWRWQRRWRRSWRRWRLWH